MARKLVPEIATAHGWYILTGIVGPCSQLLLPARRSSVVDHVDDDDPPPMTKTASSRVTVACQLLFCSNDPILFSSHWPVLASKTRQEERVLRPSPPPQVATTGLSPAVRKVVWRDRLPGREGGEHLVVVEDGRISVEATMELPS